VDPLRSVATSVSEWTPLKSVAASTSEWTADACSFTFADRPSSVHVFAMSSATDAITEAERAGFDLSLVEHSLTLTPAERAREHDGALALVLELERIRDERHAHPQSISPASR